MPSFNWTPSCSRASALLLMCIPRRIFIAAYSSVDPPMILMAVARTDACSVVCPITLDSDKMLAL